MTNPIDFAALAEMADWTGDEPPADGTSEAPRCTATAKGTGERCKRRPHPGAATCVKHGAGAPQVRDAAARRVQEEQALALAQRTIGDTDLSEFADPFAALEFAIGYGHALAVRLAKIVEGIPDGELRYRGKISEQLRGEVTAAQTALRDLRQSAADAARLGLAERRAKISAARLAHEERAFLAALQVANIPVERQEQARAVLARELLREPVIEGEVQPG